MKDRIIWGGCALLFGSGFIAGKMSGNTAFFQVANIHDLFEIAGAGATVIAAAVAVVAMGSWRRQFIYGEKYKAIKEFHAACRNCMDSYWYISQGYSLLPDVWGNKHTDNWFYNETDAFRKTMIKSGDALNGAFIVLQHHLGDEDLSIVSDSYWEFSDEVSKGCSEVLSFSTECRLIVNEPVERYDEFMDKGMCRSSLVMGAASELQIKAEELFAKFARSG